MANLSALAPMTTAATALSNVVLVTPERTMKYQPQNLPSETGQAQPPSFVFHYEGEQRLTAESDIPDHYVEDNTAVQDQIALKPVIYTTRGFIGELNDVTPGFLKPLKFIANKLVPIVGYAPSLTTTGLIAYSEAFFLYQVAQNALNAAVGAWSSIGDLLGGGDGAPQNKQQVAFQKLFGYQQARRLFTVQTPWASFQNMAISKLTPIQDEESDQWTNFEVAFKQIRFATTGPDGFLDSSVSIFQGQSATQAAPETNLGTSSPTESTSLADGISSIA